jgi:hypothetical protein
MSGPTTTWADPPTEADDGWPNKPTALAALRAQIAKRETAGVIDMYERAAWRAGASVAETEAILRTSGVT